MKPLRFASLLALALVMGGLLVPYLFDSPRGSNDMDRPAVQRGNAKQSQQPAKSTPSLMSRKPAITETGTATDLSELLRNSSRVERLFDCSFEDLQESNERRGQVPRFYFTGNDEQITESMSRVAENLDDAADPELLALAAYLHTRLSDGVDSDTVSSAPLIDSANPLVAWTVLAICEHSLVSRCVDGSALQHALTVDGGNGVVLERLASTTFRDGKTETAFAFLEQALAAPRFDTYFAAQVAMFERALAAAGVADYQDRMVSAFGFAAAMGRATESFTACTAETLSSAYWHTCRQYGERLEADSDNILDQLIGLSMQETVHRLQGDQRELHRVLERKELINASLELFGSSDIRLVMNTDEAVMRQYMEYFATYGELAAIRFVDTEVRRLAKDPAYNPCATLHRPTGEGLENPGEI